MKKDEIKRQYERLLKDVETNDFYKIDLTNRVNCYVCPNCGHVTKTKDVDSGVTPFMFKCERCGELATSTFYKDIIPNQKPTWEWYRPSLDALLYDKNDYDLDHILQGGLKSRKL